MAIFNPLGLNLEFEIGVVDKIVDKRLKLLASDLAYLKSHNVNVSRESVLDKLKTFKRIGKGGFGDVFTAMLEGYDNPMALKRIQLRSEKEDDQKLLQEVLTNTNLKHPNIVDFYYYGVEFDVKNDTVLYFLMELCHQDLAQWFEDEKQPRNHQECMKKFMDICAGLKYIHEKGYIHRDLKPKNILISLDKKVCKIADFGLARLHETRDGSVVQYFSHTAGMGTPVYVASEQLTNTHHDKKVDIFPLGLILIGFLIDAIDDESQRSLLDKIREENALPIGLIRDEFKKEIELILSMTKTCPKERPIIDEVIQRVKDIMSN